MIEQEPPTHVEPQHDWTFDEFFASRFERAVRAAFLMTYSSAAAEDIAQEAFVEIHRRWSHVRHPDAYLWRAVTNGARRWGRKARRTLPSQPVATVSFDPDTIAVRDVLATLSPAHREAIVLRFYGGFGVREIAAATGRPIGTIKSHIHRGLAAMKEQLQ